MANNDKYRWLASLAWFASTLFFLPLLVVGEGAGARGDAWGVQEKGSSGAGPLHDADDRARPWPQFKHGSRAYRGIPGTVARNSRATAGTLLARCPVAPL